MSTDQRKKNSIQSSTTDKLVLIGDYNYNLQMVLKQVISRIQQQFDLHQDLLHLWLHQENFQKLVELKDRSCYLHFMRQKHPLLEKLLGVSHADRFVQDSLRDEKEKCGHIIEEFSNGYIEYCNEHRYKHQTQHEGTFIPNEIDHFFISKSATEILDEAIFKLKCNLYIQYTRLLVKKLVEDFKQMIERTHSAFYVSYTEIEQILPWLEKNSQNFRNKMSFYDREKNLYLQIYQDRRDTKKPPCQIVRHL